MHLRTNRCFRRPRMRSSESITKSRKYASAQLRSINPSPIRAARRQVGTTAESAPATRHARLPIRVIRPQVRARHTSRLHPMSATRLIPIRPRAASRPSNWPTSSSSRSTRRFLTPMIATSRNSWIGPSNAPPTRDRARLIPMGNRQFPKTGMERLRVLRSGSTTSNRR